ncbi:hypothetical protein BCV70DRAFT_45373 [Testicularia cyperi]|uniref:Uncharacterized protein n=1 Tax=Testicularia cyperi TaxID=1882483 RepID=A0A317XIU7_9BASI|nr:hypothetical protein BCV70DRAFT_45373 [Testicularia cyperi]
MIALPRMGAPTRTDRPDRRARYRRGCRRRGWTRRLLGVWKWKADRTPGIEKRAEGKSSEASRDRYGPDQEGDRPGQQEDVEPKGRVERFWTLAGEKRRGKRSESEERRSRRRMKEMECRRSKTAAEHEEASRHKRSDEPTKGRL